jgi:hypothetical protein
MNINDKINALISLKNWAVERHMYEIASRAREVERSLLEVTTDYIRVIKPIEYLSNEQKEFLFDIQIIDFEQYSKGSYYKDIIRDLKLNLILT